LPSMNRAGVAEGGNSVSSARRKIRYEESARASVFLFEKIGGS